MITVIDIITILLCSAIMSIAASEIMIHSKITYINISILVIWIMQVMPLIVEKFFDLNIVSVPYMKMAMEDKQTAVIFDLLTIVTFLVFRLYGKKYDTTIIHGQNGILRKKHIKNRREIATLLGAMIVFIPVILIIMAPEPEVYFHYAYFYRFPYMKGSPADVYHREIMSNAIIILLLAILATYFLRKSSRLSSNLDIVFGAVVYIWLSNKRSSVLFVLMGIIAIDFIKNGEKRKIKRLIKKTVAFMLIVITYFNIYSKITGKGSSDPAFLTYLLYFGRHSAEKIAIYDKLYTNSILNYPGETILFDWTFWVLRSFWPGKPFTYTKYYTAYAYYGNGMNWFKHNLQANIWAEYVSNFGIIGHFAAMFVILTIIRLSSKTNGTVVKLLGLIFVVVYLFNSFESMLYVISAIWMFSLLLFRLKKQKKRE